MKTTKTKKETIQPHYLDEFFDPIIDPKQQKIINEIEFDYERVD